MDRLVESSATVLNTSSVVNRVFGRVDIDDLDAARGYRPLRAYGDAKLEMILFTKELHHRYHAAGISTAAFHPGDVATNFGNESSEFDPDCRLDIAPVPTCANALTTRRQGVRRAARCHERVTTSSKLAAAVFKAEEISR